MDIVNIFAFVAAVIAVGISLLAMIISRRILKFQVLYELQKDYRSGQMMSAIATLREFDRYCDSNKLNLKDEFLKRFQSEGEQVAKGKKIETTLNYKRRLVTNFYIYLASLYANKILPPELIFDLWLPSDFEMFDKFLIPLHQTLDEFLKVPQEETNFTIRHLNTLKEDGLAYFNNFQIDNEIID